MSFGVDSRTASASDDRNPPLSPGNTPSIGGDLTVRGHLIRCAAALDDGRRELRRAELRVFVGAVVEGPDRRARPGGRRLRSLPRTPRRGGGSRQLHGPLKPPLCGGAGVETRRLTDQEQVAVEPVFGPGRAPGERCRTERQRLLVRGERQRDPPAFRIGREESREKRRERSLRVAAPRPRITSPGPSSETESARSSSCASPRSNGTCGVTVSRWVFNTRCGPSPGASEYFFASTHPPATTSLSAPNWSSVSTTNSRISSTDS